MRIRICKTGWRYTYNSEPKNPNSRQAKTVPRKRKNLRNMVSNLKSFSEGWRLLWKRRHLFMSSGKNKNNFFSKICQLLLPGSGSGLDPYSAQNWIRIRTGSVQYSVKTWIRIQIWIQQNAWTRSRIQMVWIQKNFFPLIQRPEANAYLICSAH
jgi:hypothetical protein